ncbi:glutamate-rich WD repeat-containing protein 1 [Bacillus rossius redtenbacheri]|uniref:glutamate-rich WD repeat-containing protein 1 n=1 Tax=Bacillus rossius redtenbacheri TaxID=93214 RepID=UPI002FDD7DEA
MDVEMSGESNTTVKKKSKKRVYLPGNHKNDGELECDHSAYIMLHEAQTGNPCLSFDIVRDNLGNSREEYPLTAYLVGGTQAESTHTNTLIAMKLYNMHKTQKKSSEDGSDLDSDSDSDSEDDEDEKPLMSFALIKHPGCVNRIRCTVADGTTLAASWSELGNVSVWNLMPQLAALDSEQLMKSYIDENKRGSTRPLFTFSGHQVEGFGLDWSPTVPGVLASGDCKRDIHVWQPVEGGTWRVDQRPLVGHVASVEDLQWSPNERSVLASCSVDQSIRIWDTRCVPNKACKLTVSKAHESDVNVISWNRNEPFIASGGDDGVVNIWDLRQFKDGTAVAMFKHHTEPITTIEWHPSEASIFASGGSDNQIALWDLSVERDEEAGEDDMEELPQQLLFIHQGQDDIKELHWHPQLPGVVFSTAQSGFSVFRTISV